MKNGLLLNKFSKNGAILVISNAVNKIFIATFVDEINQNLNKLFDKLNLSAGEGLKIVPNKKLHITWKFIGNIDAEKNEEIFDVVKKSSCIIKNCALIFDNLEIWPSLRHPKVLVLTCKNFDEKFIEYFSDLEENLYNSLNIEKNKKTFLPHLTIGRVKSKQNIKALKRLPFDAVKIEINNINVVKSIDTKNGVFYERLFCENL